MTLQQHMDKMRELVERLDNVDNAVFIASSTALADMSQRIFSEGQSVTGGKFQYNNHDPLYVNPEKAFGNTSGLKPPTGKFGNKKFKSGKPHKTTWVESYKSLREKVGRESGFVNWEATGDLKFEVENRGTNTTTKESDNVYVVKVNSEENTGKLSGLMDKYVGVFQISEKERLKYVEVLTDELRAIL